MQRWFSSDDEAEQQQARASHRLAMMTEEPAPRRQAAPSMPSTWERQEVTVEDLDAFEAAPVESGEYSNVRNLP